MSWRTVKLKDILKQYRFEHIVKDDIEYRQVTISKYDGVRFRGIKYGKDIGRKRQFVINLDEYPKTLMLVRQGVYDGAIGLAPKEVNGCIATENMPMFSVKNIDIEFLKLIIKSTFFKKKLEEIPTTGSAQKSIHERQILEIEIPFPEITEQKDIVKKYYSSEVKISNISTALIHQLDLVKQLRQAFLREAMQGKLVPQDHNDETAGELLSKIKAGKEQLIKEKKIKKQKPLLSINENEIPFEIPDNWVWCRLGEITSLITDGKHGDCENEKDSGYYFLSAKDLQNNDFVYDNARQITYEDFLETHRRTNLEPGDLCVVNTGATIGKTVITKNNELTKKTTFQKSVAVVKVIKPYVKIQFIEYLIILQTPTLLKTSRGSAINNLLLGDMKNLHIPLPPLSEQQRIVAKLDKLMQYCDKLEQIIKTGQQQNELLLHQVLREALSKEEVDL